MNMNVLNEQLVKQTEQFFKAAQAGQMPESLQSFAKDSLGKTRDAYERMASAAQDGAKVLEAVASEAQASAKTLGETVLGHFVRNTEAAFDAAEALTRVKTLPEAAKLQAEFVRAQVETAGQQTREILELSAKVATQTFETLNAAAARSLGAGKAKR